jgi:hypothetical protein
VWVRQPGVSDRFGWHLEVEANEDQVRAGLLAMACGTMIPDGGRLDRIDDRLPAVGLRCIACQGEWSHRAP